MINWEDDGMTLWDFRAGTSSSYDHKSLTDNVSGHFDMGADFMANSDGVYTGLVVRTYDATRAPDNIVQYRRPDGRLNWTIADHVSLREDDEQWVLGSTYVGDGSYAAFEKEIYLARTDGAGFVRLAHTRSTESATDPNLRYFSQPRAVIDTTGRYVVYTSDLGSSSRTDVMILRIPSSLWES